MILTDADLDAIAERVAARIQAPASAVMPETLTVAQAMTLTGHRTRRAFHYWARAKKLRPISRGRYARRRLEAVCR